MYLRHSKSVYNKVHKDTVYVDGGDLGEEIELQVTFRICPAEPDVGINADYAEIDETILCGMHFELPNDTMDKLAEDILIEMDWGDHG